MKALDVAVGVKTFPNIVVNPIISISGELKAAQIAIASSANVYSHLAVFITDTCAGQALKCGLVKDWCRYLCQDRYL